MKKHIKVPIYLEKISQTGKSDSTKSYRKWKVFCGIRPIEVMVLRIRKGKIGRSFLF